ncbi:MAG: folate-binding protein YgfZ [Burkholderiales bacterium]|nr:MAG: folate-binding protein YgfZ [Burkholderiales bacterium]
MLAATAPAGFDDTVVRDLCQMLGARFERDPYGPQCLFDSGPAVVPADGFVAPLTDLGLIEVTGQDALSFLQGQTTNDVAALDADRAQWTGYCSPKGRLLGTMLAWTDGEAFRLLLARALAAPIQKRLSMYVLRAKARLVDRSDEFVAFGLVGAAVRQLGVLGLAAPEPMGTRRADGLEVIGLEPVPAGAAPGIDAPLARAVLMAPSPRAGSVWSALTAGAVPASSPSWRWTEVLSGIPRVSEATRELFVPQMLNFELIGGVNFKKGCYPGQEVVARSHYLGKLKRRSFRGHIAHGDEPAPGADVYVSDSAEPTGQVVLAAASPLGGVDLLFEAQTAAVQSAREGTRELRATTPDGAPIAVAPLPYTVPA